MTEVLVGEAVAGQSAKTRAALEQLIATANKSKFDIAELLYEVKRHGFYAPYTTFAEYTETLKIKKRSVQIYTRMVEVFAAVGIPRQQYEPLGIARCREITSLNPNEAWKNPETNVETPMAEFIKDFVAKGEDLEMEDLKRHVRTLKGFVGEDDLTWVNIQVKRSANDNIIRPALEKMKALLGSGPKDDEGISKDASDGAALEAMAVEVLNDPHLSNGMELDPEEEHHEYAVLNQDRDVEQEEEDAFLSLGEI